jgi:hypothetical protein
LQANTQVCCSAKCQLTKKLYYSAKCQLTKKFYYSAKCQLTKKAMYSSTRVEGLCGLQGTGFKEAGLSGALAPRSRSTTVLLLADQG